MKKYNSKLVLALSSEIDDKRVVRILQNEAKEVFPNINDISLNDCKEILAWQISGLREEIDLILSSPTKCTASYSGLINYLQLNVYLLYLTEKIDVINSMILLEIKSNPP